MKIKTGDMVKVIAGKNKGLEGKVVSALPAKMKVVVEGVNVVKKHQKPTQANTAGGIIEKTLPIHISNVAYLASKGKASRVGYKVDSKGNKSRVLRQAGNKEIK